MVKRPGQATVEGAFLIPLIFLLLLMMLQPGILLFDRTVMKSAAAEACRMLATCETQEDRTACEEALRRRLGAIPQQENFHVHEGGCSWEIDLVGDEKTSETKVSLRTEVAPLPLVDMGATVLGLTNDAGNFMVAVEASSANYPGWVEGNPMGLDPQAWVEFGRTGEEAT